MPKNLPYYELFYDSQDAIVKFILNPFEKLTKRTDDPAIYLFNKSTIALNGVLPSEMDSASIIEKYGKPEHAPKVKNGPWVLSYDFRKKRYFSLLDFYFNSDGTINKIRILFGKYPRGL